MNYWLYNKVVPPITVKYLSTAAEQIWSHPTWDLILIFALLAGGFFYGLMAGKRRIAATIMYTYVALAVSSALPVGRWFAPSTELEIFWIRAGSFLTLFLILAFFLGSRRSGGFAPAGTWWQIFLLSFLQAGLLIHLVLGLLPDEKIKMLAPLTKNVFANPNYHIWWLVVPLVVLIFLRWLERKEE